MPIPLRHSEDIFIYNIIAYFNKKFTIHLELFVVQCTLNDYRLKGETYMKHRLFNAVKLLMILCMLFILCSCASTVDDLYQLPQLSEQNFQLQEQMDAILNRGASYSPPSSGSHRQSVQLQDLNGDGTREAIAFFRVPNADKPLNIRIFSYTNGEYVESAKIEGEGESIDSISYSDMDSDGHMELIIGWQIGVDIKLLTIYTITDFQPYLVQSTNYTDYSLCNLNNSGENVFVVRTNPSSMTGEAELYTLRSDGEMESDIAALSVGITAVSRIQTSQLLNGVNAVFVECTTAEGMITDIFTFQINEFTNITGMTSDPALSGTYRKASAYCTDINNDNVLDIPVLIPINTSSDSTTTYYATRWYSYSSSGRQSLTMTTFHNDADGWYFVLSDTWLDEISIRRETSPGTRSIVFSVNIGNNTTEDFLVISALTGDNREDNAISGDRFILATHGEVSYTGEIVSELVLPFEVSKELVSDCFELIYSEWVVTEK